MQKKKRKGFCVNVKRSSICSFIEWQDQAPPVTAAANFCEEWIDGVGKLERDIVNQVGREVYYISTKFSGKRNLFTCLPQHREFEPRR